MQKKIATENFYFYFSGPFYEIHEPSYLSVFIRHKCFWNKNITDAHAKVLTNKK